MANPAKRFSGSASTGTSTISAGLALVAGGSPVSGDEIYLILVQNESPPYSSVSVDVADFSAFSSVSGTFNKITILRKVSAGTEGTTYNISWSGGLRDGGGSGWVFIVSSPSGSTPTNIVTGTDTTSNTTFDIGAITMAQANSLEVVAVTSDGNNSMGASSAIFSSWGDTLTEDADIADSANGGHWGDLGGAYASRVSSGARAATSVTAAVADKSLYILWEIEPAAAGTTTKRNNLTLLGVS